MMNNNVIIIEDDDLSQAWARAFLSTMKPGITGVSPMIVVVSGLSASIPNETKWIRDLLDQKLLECGEASIETVAGTMFPRSLWNPKLDRAVLFSRYLEILPRIRHHPRNKYGTYFERLITYGNAENSMNQLDHIINTYQNGNHRGSALQATILDPLKDHTHQRQRGFPCLQQINFTPVGTGKLDVTGLYAKQHIFSKAYGNYLGLARLGQFVAYELGLTLDRIICHASMASVGNVGKADVLDLENALNIALSTIPSSSN